jgi:hypothetical protein
MFLFDKKVTKLFNKRFIKISDWWIKYKLKIFIELFIFDKIIEIQKNNKFSYIMLPIILSTMIMINTFKMIFNFIPTFKT